MLTMRTVSNVYSITGYRRDGRINLPYKFLGYEYDGRTKLTDLEKCLVANLVRVYMVTTKEQIKRDTFDTLFGMIYPCSRFEKCWYDESSWKNELEKAMTINHYAKIRPEEKVIRIIEKFMRTKKRNERRYELAEEKYC